MIRTMFVSNYRSLGPGVTVRLGPFTALVGVNGSGKSNVVDAIRFVRDSMEMGLSGAITHRHGMAAVRRWSGGHPYDVEIKLELEIPDGHATYAFELQGDRAEEYRIKYEDVLVAQGAERHRLRVEGGTWTELPDGVRPKLDERSLALPLVGGDTRFAPLFDVLQRMQVYAIYPDTLNKPQAYSPSKPMSQHGENWISVLKDQPPETWKPDLLAALAKLTGDVDDLRVAQAASYLVVQFRHSSEARAKKWFEAAQESDGTLRFAGILTALLQQPYLPVIGVEEPELTVHPGALPLLYDHLLEASQRSQVIITTHSPELLDLCGADDIRVVTRRRGVTSVAPLQERQRSSVRDGLLSLGEVMVREGLQQDLDLGAEE